jgi:hypothetical protein
MFILSTSLLYLALLAALSLMMALHESQQREWRPSFVSFMGGYAQSIMQQAGFSPTPEDTILTSSGVIPVSSGTIFLDAGSALAMTLAAPLSGSPSAGGQDGTIIEIISLTAEAHTVTTPADAISGGFHIATFGGAIGDLITLRAQDGLWIPVANNGVVLS